ncbi:MAG: hypothetical protein ACXQT4_04430 [Methanotrichaceae archaeon]
MSGKKLKFRCFECNSENIIEDSEICNEGRTLVVCGNCGLVNETTSERIRDALNDQDNWLICIPFTGPERRLPLGKIETADGMMLYVTAADMANRLTRNEFIMKYGNDPEITLKRMGRDRECLNLRKLDQAKTSIKVGKYVKPRSVKSNESTSKLKFADL